MLPPEDYARSSRRWGVAAIGSYVVFLSAAALIDRGFLDRGVLIPLAIVAGIVCLIMTSTSLFRWTQCDVSDGRYFSRPGRSTLVRYALGPLMLVAGLLLEDQLGDILEVSGFCYLISAFTGECFCYVWAWSLVLSPPAIAVVPAVGILSFYASFFCLMFVGTSPLTEIDITVSVALLIIGIVILLLLRHGSHKGEAQAFVPTRLFYRPLTPRERLALGLSAGLDIIVAAFAFWTILNIYL